MSTETSTSEEIMVCKDKASLFLMVVPRGDSSVYHCAFFSIQSDVLGVARMNCDPSVFRTTYTGNQLRVNSTWRPKYSNNRKGESLILVPKQKQKQHPKHNLLFITNFRLFYGVWMEKTTIEWLGNSKMENTCDIQIK